MDSLIGLLIIIGIISKLAKKNKQQKKDAASSPVGKAQAARQDTAIPFSRDEWTQFLKQTGIPGPEKKAAEPAEKKKPAAVPGQVQMDEIRELRNAVVKQRAARKTAAEPAVKPALQHDDPEGTISTQGETHAEHAAHRRRILAEEERLQQEMDALAELRNANLQKLRTAVVMSEVLGKPVALRGRRR